MELIANICIATATALSLASLHALYKFQAVLQAERPDPNLGLATTIKAAFNTSLLALQSSMANDYARRIRVCLTLGIVLSGVASVILVAGAL